MHGNSNIKKTLLKLAPISSKNLNIWSLKIKQYKVQQNSTNPDAGCPGPSGKFVENSTKPTCLEIAGYRTKYSTVLWLLELQLRLGRKG